MAEKNAIDLKYGLRDVKFGFSYLITYLRFMIRAWVYKKQTMRWLDLLNTDVLLNELAKRCPVLVLKIFRPYITDRLSCEERLAAITSHYNFIRKRNLTDLIRQSAGQDFLLGTMKGKGETLYSVYWHAVDRFEREGELAFNFKREQDLMYSVIFSFSDLQKHPVLSVGCLQGVKTEAALADIRFATRDLYGLRPKHLMMILVEQLGFLLGCEKLFLVGNHNRAVRAAMRKGRVLSDYDQFWKELGAVAGEDGDFEKNCETLKPLDLEKMASKKRSEARKRYELLTTIIEVMKNQLLQYQALSR